MATLISATTFGIYITQEENGQIAANTPGGIDLDNLTLGDTYIYFGEIQSFQVKIVSQKEGEKVLGWKMVQTANTGTMSGSVFGGAHAYYTFKAIATYTQVENMQKLFRLHIQKGDGVKYLVFQRGSTDFIQFPTPAGTLKKYAEIVIRDVQADYVYTASVNKWEITITCEACQDRN